jgi:outer membrane protein assembly factor BamB
VVGNRVYIMDHQGANDVLRALDLATGKQAWAFKYAEPGGNNYGFARSTPTVAGGKVYTCSRSGQVMCVNAANGKKVWGISLARDFAGQKPQWDYSASLLLDGGKLIVLPGGQTAAVVALNPATGKAVWKGGKADQAGYATPVPATIGGVKQYVVFSANYLSGVNAANGKTVWSFPWKTQYGVNAATPRVIGGKVFITSGYGHGCALVAISGSTAKAAWQNKNMQSMFNSPVVVGGSIYGTTDPGKLVCLNAANGAVKWQQPGFEKGGVIAVDGTLVAMAGATGDAVTVALSAAKYQELGRFKPLGGQSWSPPVVAGGKLLVRNKTALACFNLR